MSAAALGAIFDLDGTLVDSFDAHLVAWQRMSERHGVPITLAHFERHFGRRNDEMVRDIWREAGQGELSDAVVTSLGREKELIYRDLVTATFPIMDGGPELMRALHDAGWKLAIASSAPIENVDLAIDSMRVRAMLDAIVTGDDVRRGKPDPECFLTAAARLGVPPARCVVLEDAPAGIVAAKAARMRCAVITSKGHRRETQRDADIIVNSLRELSPQRLAELVAQQPESVHP